MIFWILKTLRMTGKAAQRAAFSFLIFSVALAQTHKEPLAPESPREAIARANSLSLQKDRLQALYVLKNAIKKESKKTSSSKEIIQTLHDLAFVFYSEKAQQLHEVALSLLSTDLPAAQLKMKEALKMEPDNFSLEMTAARIGIAMGDCGSSFERLAKYKDFIPYVEDLRLGTAQAQLCLGKIPEATTLKNSTDNKLSELAIFWVTLEAESLFRQNLLSKLNELISTNSNLKGNPELSYWKWKSEVELKQKAEKSAAAYINQCKVLTKRQIRNLLFEPNLCRHMPEVENYLKKNNNPDT